MVRPKPKNGKKKAGEKKVRPRGGGFGFNKTKELKEIVGSRSSSSSSSSSKSSTALMDRSTSRSMTRLEHDGDEEVFVVSSGSVLDEKPKFTKFSQLSSIIPALTSGTAIVPDLEDAKEEEEESGDLGFFFDSRPSKPSATPNDDQTLFEYDLPATKKPTLTKYQKQKQRIIRDDSVYISSDEETKAVENDDNASISSSEDISMLQALSHWGNNDMLLFEDTPTKNNKVTSDDEDYAVLEGTALDDICVSSSDDDEVGDLNEDEQDNILLENDLSFDLLDNVPESLKNSYRGMIAQEKSRVKRQAKNQLQFNERRKKMRKKTAEPPSSRHQNKNNLLDQILHDFIEVKDLEMYKLGNLTYHGRKMIIPKIAKLFQLEISELESNKKNIVLKKTSKTCIPESYKQRVKKMIVLTKKTKTVSASRLKARSIRQSDMRAMRDDKLHGQVVAAKSEPISSSNIGHRMLAAMGWKTGDAIGNRQDGIKEPIQVHMRANRRGLGA